MFFKLITMKPPSTFIIYQTYFLLLLLLVRTTPFMTAQMVTAGNSPLRLPAAPQKPYAGKFNFNISPTMALLMVVFGSFLLIGFFAVYVSRCAESRFRQANFDPETGAGGAVVGGRGRRWGLDVAVIETFPSFAYSAVKRLKIGNEALECAVCLNEFEDDDMLRLIPKCSHVFHAHCVDTWLRAHTTCPVCRANLVPVTGDLPLEWILRVENTNPGEPTGLERDDQLCVDVGNRRDGNNDEPRQEPSPGTNVLGSIIRSWSGGWGLGQLFTRSHSTGHSLVRPGDSNHRFTLQLPDEVRVQLMHNNLIRSKSCVVFPRSKSGGSGHGQNYFYNERFDEEGQPDRLGFTMHPPFFSRTSSIWSSSPMLLHQKACFDL